MENNLVQIGGFSLKIYSTNTLIIGSGAASLNAAVRLHSKGQPDIIIATSKLGAGTSNNAGSDKQTYYKLSLSGTEPDSVIEMARDLFNGKCMHGDIALCEAQGSVPAFLRLADLGVPFPHDKYGSWAGYKTDHDPRSRATSAGPHTSAKMFSVLANEVKRRKIKILDNHMIVELLTDSNKTMVTGAVAINKNEKDPSKAFVIFNAVNVILGTGGPGDLYSESVYPFSQTGSAGMAFRAGAQGQNLTESQFGIASLDFRWNLSGSYQQVIPRYFSTDKYGRDEKEFLNDNFTDHSSLIKAIFLKGYQWPFDVEKISGFGSSLIDLLVFKEKTERGRRVFIDYRRNVSWKGDDRFSPDKLGHEVRNYLSNSHALQDLPFMRLRSINLPAFEFFISKGTDLSVTPLEIGICAQHNNGGLTGNIWWESNLRHLFPVGEVNGSHGVKRPGGSALNSGQVGSSRAAEFIAHRYNSIAPETDKFIENSYDSIEELLGLSSIWLSGGESSGLRTIDNEIRIRMSKFAGIFRDYEKISAAAAEATVLNKTIRDKISARSVKELAECFSLYNNCLAHLIYLEAIRQYIDRGGRSRGSCIVTGKGETSSPDFSAGSLDVRLCRYNREVENGILEVRYLRNKVVTTISAVREIPDQNLWFEKVWREYLEDNYMES